MYSTLLQVWSLGKHFLGHGAYDVPACVLDTCSYVPLRGFEPVIR